MTKVLVKAYIPNIDEKRGISLDDIIDGGSLRYVRPGERNIGMDARKLSRHQRTARGANIPYEIEVARTLGADKTIPGLLDLDNPTQINPNFNVTGTYKKVLFVTFRKGKVLGAWDSHQSAYTLSMQTKPRTISKEANTFATLGYDEQIKGWTSFYSFKPVLMGSLKNNFYTFIDSNIYQHYDESVPNSRCKFYGATEPDKAFVEFIFNPNPTVMKNFNTIAYEGNNGWEVTSYKSDFEGYDQIENAGTFEQYQDSTSFIRSYVEGQYDSANPPNYGTAATVQPIFRAGFDRKENHYVANLINNSTARPGEIIFGNQVSGVKGYLMTVKMSIDNDTDTGGAKQLFSVSSNYVLSSR